MIKLLCKVNFLCAAPAGSRQAEAHPQPKVGVPFLFPTALCMISVLNRFHSLHLNKSMSDSICARPLYLLLLLLLDVQKFYVFFIILYILTSELLRVFAPDYGYHKNILQCFVFSVFYISKSAELRLFVFSLDSPPAA